MLTFVALALAAEPVTLPVGRAHVVPLDGPPRSIAVDNDRLRVEQMPPYLVILGVRAGASTVRVGLESGERVLSVQIPAEGDASSALALPVDEGYLLPLPDDMVSHVVVRPDVAQVVPFGTKWMWVQGAKAGVTDVVIERSEGAPRIWTLAVGADGPPPADAHPPTGSFTVPLGGTLAVSLGTTPVGQIVGHPSRLEVRDASAAELNLELVGKRAGSTWLVTGHADGAIGVYRVEVRSPPAP